MTPSGFTISSQTILPASFRDPDGYLYRSGGVLFRALNKSYRENYERLINSGLYGALIAKRLIIPHTEVDTNKDVHSWLTIQPEPVAFISYPYEWCFSQLKDAALLTLDIQFIALNHGMSLKDASAYNVQFHQGRPIFIDTLSFESYVDGMPWVAYRQFCQHFLAPLTLMAKRDIRLGQLMRNHIDGLPLDLASNLLPKRSWTSVGILMHLHMHARTQQSFANSHAELSKTALKFSRVSRTGLIGLLDGLRKTITKLEWKPGNTEWSDYYNDTNYSDNAFQSKRRQIEVFLDNAGPKNEVWDLGANIGLFSRIASEKGLSTVAFDIDPSAVEINYRQVRRNGEKTILPLLLDLTNPSPGLGWNSTERESLVDRGPVDCLMALALIHHISISNNVPFNKVASFFAQLCRKSLIIEFVPKSDSQVQRLLRSRVDIFENYTRDQFEKAFSLHFLLERAEPIEGSDRVLYLMRRKP
jgi:ribosomal protein L11 methylase PrmA